MGDVKIPYYVVKLWKGRAFGYWQPTKRMRELGFQAVRCGPDGPDAWRRANDWNQKWQAARRGLPTASIKKVWPRGSFGEAFERYKRTETWAAKAPRTREEWERSWARIEPVFGDVAPHTVDLETIDLFYGDPKVGLLGTVGVREAHRVIKTWRALWRVAAAMGYCDRDADPSLAIRRKTPKARSLVWREGEVVRLVKRAIRRGYYGLAVVMAVAWDTQFSPADVRAVSRSTLREEGGRLLIDLSRCKTGAAALGTLSRRTERLLRWYLEQLGAELLPYVPIFRNRSGAIYSKDTLGDDFRDIRAELFPGDRRTIGHDMRRSGTVEAFVGGADPSHVASKMANTIDQASDLQRTYNPVNQAAVALADEARKRGRQRIRENG